MIGVERDEYKLIAKRHGFECFELDFAVEAMFELFDEIVLHLHDVAALAGDFLVVLYDAEDDEHEFFEGLVALAQVAVAGEVVLDLEGPSDRPLVVDLLQLFDDRDGLLLQHTLPLAQQGDHFLHRVVVGFDGVVVLVSGEQLVEVDADLLSVDFGEGGHGVSDEVAVVLIVVDVEVDGGFHDFLLLPAGRQFGQQCKQFGEIFGDVFAFVETGLEEVGRHQTAGGGGGGDCVLEDDRSDFAEFQVLFFLWELDDQVILEQCFDDEFDILV